MHSQIANIVANVAEQTTPSNGLHDRHRIAAINGAIFFMNKKQERKKRKKRKKKKKDRFQKFCRNTKEETHCRPESQLLLQPIDKVQQ
jgi:hypothetical protein